MNQKEIVDAIFEDIEKTRERLLKTLRNSQSSAFEKRFDQKWNAPEIIGHLYRFEEELTSYFKNFITPSSPKVLPEFTGKRLSQAWFDSMNNDNEKYHAPDIFIPERILKDEYEEKLKKSREKLRNAVYSSLAYDFARIIVPHPNGVKLNLVQWLELMSVHEKRHIRQLERLAV